RESDPPPPVALAHQVIGGHRPVAFDESCLPARVVAPLADVDFGRNPQPNGVAVVFVAAFEVQLAGRRPVASRSIDHPTCRGGTGGFAVLNENSMGLPSEAELDRCDSPRGDFDTFRQAASIQLVLQPGAVD